MLIRNHAQRKYVLSIEKKIICIPERYLTLQIRFKVSDVSAPYKID